jgi:hypothetical protein
MKAHKPKEKTFSCEFERTRGSKVGPPPPPQSAQRNHRNAIITNTTTTRMDVRTVTKLQALWRGYAARKGISTPCCSCGFPMTLKPPQYPETMSAVFFSVAPCSRCAHLENDSVQSEPYIEQEDDDEPYIPCCMCGANCYGWDYENWRICSRSCLVKGNRDW